ncbi:hypothetical protein BN946_scf184921.g28 [Trametes cinnabarina]|uniref:F-box domain-containing protein n=1 Tax=Pycnoporus cinnabarinus TaxID=5643 RepID=A0A060SMK9_PYCCI|nr:hypothetical protein BN946_scf184921.g28 [Trametes cinnabarina]
MGSDGVCLLCGIRYVRGPVWWCGTPPQLTAEDITQEALNDLVGLDDEAKALTSDLTDIFARHDVDYVLRAAVNYDHEGDSIAIGHFDLYDGGYQPCHHHGLPLHPTGHCVQVRRVRSSVGGGLFGELVELQRGERIVNHNQSTNCDTWWKDPWKPSCNIWVHVACWTYLREWLNCPSPSRASREPEGQLLDLAGELYEVANTQHKRRVSGKGSLPCIDYGGTLDAFDKCDQYQDYILGPRVGTKHLVQALKEGQRGQGLVPALLEDCRFWMFVRPDIWPYAPHPGPYDPYPAVFVSECVPQPRSLVCRLPNELLPELLQHFRLQDIFSLASTCKDLHLRILNRSTLAVAIRNAMTNLSSPLHWIMPVSGLREEWLNACDAMATWLPRKPRSPTFAEFEFPEEDDEDGDYVPSECSYGEGETVDTDQESQLDSGEEHDRSRRSGHEAHEADTDDDDEGLKGCIVDVPVPDPTTAPLPPLPLFDPSFPLSTFLSAYRESDSMRSRRRRWELIKQWDVLFTNYRRDGWERGDDFCVPGTRWAMDAVGRLRCHCGEESA